MADGNEQTDKVYVVLADYGLNGSGVLGVYYEPPTTDLLRQLESTPPSGLPYHAPNRVTGFNGLEVVEQLVSRG
ncbi:hypothetical protein ACIOD2_32295 [Amycolatopsis sp. NPDC088138]|uniref:hypothetical protein n=1 Tax=Amycolatopsis sp. NPDC088138 TaxID=3363938 RepID=UPI0038093DB6